MVIVIKVDKDQFKNIREIEEDRDGILYGHGV